VDSIKPICEALGVDYITQFKATNKSKILSQLLSDMTMVAADGKFRKMISLPEFAIYGWIFKIEANAPGMDDYQWECYRLLYEHFHGSITGRKELLSEKVRLQMEIDKYFNTLDPEIAFKLDLANGKLNKINGKLRSLDQDVMQEEKTLFDT